MTEQEKYDKALQDLINGIYEAFKIPQIVKYLTKILEKWTKKGI